jgi:hypothetical protein
MTKPGAIRVQVRQFCAYQSDSGKACKAFFWRWAEFDHWRSLKGFVKGEYYGTIPKATDWTHPERWCVGTLDGTPVINAFYCPEHAEHAEDVS